MSGVVVSLHGKALRPLAGDRLSRVLDQIPPPLAFLADAVTTRRRALGLTRVELHEAGGPSDSTMARIETPTATTTYPRPSTLARLDASLKWVRGSAAGCLELRDPVPVERNETTDPPAAHQPSEPEGVMPAAAIPADPLDFDTVGVPISVLRDGLRLIQQNLVSTDLPGGQRALSDLIQFAQRLSAAHATEVMERFGGPTKSIPGFVEITFGPYLAPEPPFDAPTEQELDDQRYRRWLVGHEDDLAGRYERRLARKLRAIALDAL